MTTLDAEPILVLIVEDHPIIQDGLKYQIQKEAGGTIEVIGTVSTGEQAIKFILESPRTPDIVLMDVMLPGKMHGVAATAKITKLKLKNKKRPKVIGLTVCSAFYPMRLVKAGAKGYILKQDPASLNDIVNAIRTVHSGQSYFTQQVAQDLALRQFMSSKQTPFDSLSDKDLQIVLMIVADKSTDEIADQLHLSPKTVSCYRHRLCKRLKVKNELQLYMLAVQYGLVEKPLSLENTENAGSS